MGQAGQQAAAQECIQGAGTWQGDQGVIEFIVVSRQEQGGRARFALQPQPQRVPVDGATTCVVIRG